MDRIQNENTRYFIEIDLDTLQLVRVGFDQKQPLDKGQPDESRHSQPVSFEGAVQ